MLPESVQRLIENQRGESISTEELKAILRKQGCNEEYIKSVLAPAEKKLQSLGISEGSTFFEFYKSVKYLPIGQGEELLTLDQIIDEKESRFHEDECPGIYDRFVQISAMEGEGSYFYEMATDIVYDADWGEEQAMMAGTLNKKWPSFYSFLEWYYSNEI